MPAFGSFKAKNEKSVGFRGGRGVGQKARQKNQEEEGEEKKDKGILEKIQSGKIPSISV